MCVCDCVTRKDCNNDDDDDEHDLDHKVIDQLLVCSVRGYVQSSMISRTTQPHTHA